MTYLENEPAQDCTLGFCTNKWKSNLDANLLFERDLAKKAAWNVTDKYLICSRSVWITMQCNSSRRLIWWSKSAVGHDRKTCPLQPKRLKLLLMKLNYLLNCITKPQKQPALTRFTMYDQMKLQGFPNKKIFQLSIVCLFSGWYIRGTCHLIQ